MIKDVPYQIIGFSYPERSVEFDIQKTVNWYLVEDPNSVKKMAFAPTPGTEIINKPLNDSAVPVRQIFSYKNFGLAFVGDQVYHFDQDYDVNPVGTIKSNAGFISVCSGPTQIMIVDGEGGYVYTYSTGVLEPITDPNFLNNPLMCAYFNDFFVVCDTDTNVWQTSEANNAKIWTILSAPNDATISAKADTFKGIGVVNQRLFLFGNYITETWYAGVNPQYPQFPYSRDNNAIFEYGCAASNSICNGDKKDDGVLYWLGRTRNGVGSVMMSDGGQARNISTPSLDWRIQNYKRVDDAIGFSYNQDGHNFYQLTFPSENVTWLADMTMVDEEGYPSWINLSVLNGDCHMATCHTYFIPTEQHLIGSNQGPYILNLSSKVYTNFAGYDDNANVLSEDIKRVRIGSNFYLPNYNRFFINKFEADFEGGVGLANPPGYDPQVFLSISYDYGHTFGDSCRAGMGKIGQFKKRMYWFARGYTRSFIPMIVCYDPVRCYLMGANLQIEEGRS